MSNKIIPDNKIPVVFLALNKMLANINSMEEFVGEELTKIHEGRTAEEFRVILLQHFDTTRARAHGFMRKYSRGLILDQSGLKNKMTPAARRLAISHKMGKSDVNLLVKMARSKRVINQGDVDQAYRIRHPQKDESDWFVDGALSCKRIIDQGYTGQRVRMQGRDRKCVVIETLLGGTPKSLVSNIFGLNRGKVEVSFPCPTKEQVRSVLKKYAL